MITHHIHAQAHRHCLLTTHLKEEAPTNVANPVYRMCPNASPAHTTSNQASRQQTLQNLSIGCAQMHRLLTPHLTKQAHTKTCILILEQNPTLRIRCPFPHRTLLYLAKPANDVCRSLPASQMDRCPNQMCSRWPCTPTSQEAAS